MLYDLCYPPYNLDSCNKTEHITLILFVGPNIYFFGQNDMSFSPNVKHCNRERESDTKFDIRICAFFLFEADI